LNRDEIEPFVGGDGAIVRELASPANSGLTRHSLAEIRHPPGTASQEHFHRGRGGVLRNLRTLIAQYVTSIDYLFPFLHNKHDLYIQCFKEAALGVKVVSHHLQLFSDLGGKFSHRLDLFSGQQVLLHSSQQTCTLSFQG
jgi:hypothetical protein